MATESHRPRYFRNDAPLARRDPHKQLIASLTRLVTEYPPDKISPGGGFYYGPTSVAFLFYTLHKLYPDVLLEDFPLTTWSTAYLETAQANMKAYDGPTVKACGISEDIMAILALFAASSKDPDTIGELCRYAAVTADPEASNEWLYGRAGYLYFLRFVKHSLLAPNPATDEPPHPDTKALVALLDDTADEVIETIMDAPRPWKWHEKAYVGAAHGMIGIITQIVLTDASWAPKLEVDLGALLSFQYDSGNWPAHIPPTRDRLVQFCHGAPGVVASLLSVRPHFPKLHERIDAAIAKGRTCILERGLLTKEPCLCHGISGNALALDGDHFENFLAYTTGHEIKAMERDGMLEKSDDPSALWAGEAGRAWAWAVADLGLEKRFLGYNDV